MSKLEFKNVSKTFNSTQALNDINFNIKESEYIVVVGPSGCGKSTFLRTIAGLEDITNGEIWFDGKRIDRLNPVERSIAMVFQSYALYPHMNVQKNITFGAERRREEKEEIVQRLNDVTQTLQLDGLLDRKPGELSGGQRQRVAIARAMIRRPGVLLLDEPLSNLDASLRANTRIELSKLHKSMNAIILHVTHDQHEAMTLADRIVIMNQGKVVQIGTPKEIYKKPANLFVAGFIGSPGMNLINGELASRHNATTIGVRPEDINISKTSNGIPASVEAIEYLGNESHIHLTIEKSTAIIMSIKSEFNLQSGDTIDIEFNAPNISCFDESGVLIA